MYDTALEQGWNVQHICQKANAKLKQVFSWDLKHSDG